MRDTESKKKTTEIETIETEHNTIDRRIFRQQASWSWSGTHQNAHMLPFVLVRFLLAGHNNQVNLKCLFVSSVYLIPFQRFSVVWFICYIHNFTNTSWQTKNHCTQRSHVGIWLVLFWYLSQTNFDASQTNSSNHRMAAYSKIVWTMYRIAQRTQHFYTLKL